MQTETKKSLPSLTEGSILRTLLVLSGPIVLSNLLHTAYQLIDTFWVGRLGAEAVASVALSFPVIFLMIALGGGFTMAGSILVSQYKGAQDDERVNHVSGQTLLMSMLICLPLSLLGFLAAEPVLRLMGAEPAVLPMATSYLQISFVGMIFMFIFFMFQSLLRGVGNVRTPMLVILLTVLMNLVLDPLFIMGWGPIPGYGVAGAAIATIFSQFVAAAVGLWMLFGGKYGVQLKWSELKPDKPIIKKMFFLGLPSSIELSTRALGLSVMAFLVATFGTLTVAAYGIGIRIFSFVVIPAFGLSMATATLVGQNMGAGKVDRAEQTALKSAGIGFVILAAIGVLFFIFAIPITQAFIPNDPEVVKSGALFVRIMAICFGFIGLQQVLNGAFMGSGNTMMSMMLSIVSLWVFEFPVAYILSKHTSLAEVGIWWSFPVANILAAILAYAWFKKGSWKKRQLVESKLEKLEAEVIKESMIEEGVR